MNKNSIFRSVILALVVSSLIYGVCPSPGQARNSIRFASESPKTAVPEPIAQTFGGFWRVGNGFTTNLIVRNRDRNSSILTHLVLYSQDGRERKKTQFQIAANSVHRLPIEDILKNGEDSQGSGGLALQFSQQSKPNIMGEVVIENEEQGVIFDIPLQAGNRFDSAKALYAPWWLPDKKTDGKLSLFNSSTDKIAVIPMLRLNGQETPCGGIKILPHETREFDLREMMAKCEDSETDVGALVLHYVGPVHSLQPTLLLSNPKTGFSLVSSFNAEHPHLVDQKTTWQFPDVFISADSGLGFDPNEKLTAYALLSNGTINPQKPSIDAYIGGANGTVTRKVELPIDKLKPLETRLVNLSKFVHSGLIPANTSHIALRARHEGLPGDLGISVFSVGKSKNFVFRSEGRPSSGRVVDSSYWDISGNLTALLAVQNAGKSDVDIRPVLYYQTSTGTGNYTLPSINLSGHGSQIINLKDVILSGAPDEQGNSIPAGTTFGTLTLNVQGEENKNLIFGGSTSLDPAYGGYGELINPQCDCDPFFDPFCDPFPGDPELGDPDCPPECGVDIFCGDPGDGLPGILVHFFQGDSGEAGEELPSHYKVGISKPGRDRTGHLQAISDPRDTQFPWTVYGYSQQNKMEVTNIQDGAGGIGITPFDVVGTVASNPLDGMDVNYVEAREYGNDTSIDVAVQLVDIVVPDHIATPHEVTGNANGGLIIRNVALDSTTSPTATGLNPPNAALATMYVRFLTIKVLDQFGDDSIGSLYMGAPVTESGNTIQQTIRADGTYLDPVGALFPSPPPIVNTSTQAGATARDNWLTAAPAPAVTDQKTQNIDVEVDGFVMNDGVNPDFKAIHGRLVSIQAGNPGNVTISW